MFAVFPETTWNFTVKFYTFMCLSYLFPSVLWRCLLGDRKGIRSVESWMLVCWWWWFDCSFACLTVPVVTTTSIYLAPIKPANPGSPGKWPLKWRQRATEVLSLWVFVGQCTAGLHNFAFKPESCVFLNSCCHVSLKVHRQAANTFLCAKRHQEQNQSRQKSFSCSIYERNIMRAQFR